MTRHLVPAALGSREASLFQSAQRKLNQKRLTGIRKPAFEEAPLSIRNPVRAALALLMMAALPTIFLVYFESFLRLFWQHTLAFWNDALDLSLVLQTSHDGSTQHGSSIGDGAGAPSATSLWITGIVVGLVFVMSDKLPDRYFPLRVMVRGLCVIEAIGVGFFWLIPASFPYTVTQHLSTILDLGYSFMLMLAPMLALGWGILNVSWPQKMAVPLLMAGYFSLMLPHKALLHVWLLQKTSLLHMPLLFLCFGTLVDLMVFIALYGWLVSTVPVLSNAD